jgi:hypothetical protein
MRDGHGQASSATRLPVPVTSRIFLNALMSVARSSSMTGRKPLMSHASGPKQWHFVVSILADPKCFRSSICPEVHSGAGQVRIRNQAGDGQPDRHAFVQQRACRADESRSAILCTGHGSGGHCRRGWARRCDRHQAGRCGASDHVSESEPGSVSRAACARCAFRCARTCRQVEATTLPMNRLTARGSENLANVESW